MTDFPIKSLRTEVDDVAPQLGIADVEAHLAREIRERRRPCNAVRGGRETMRRFESGPDGTFFVLGAPKTPAADAEIVPGWWAS